MVVHQKLSRRSSRRGRSPPPEKKSRTPVRRAAGCAGSLRRRGSGAASRSSTRRSAAPSRRALGRCPSSSPAGVRRIPGEVEPAVLHRLNGKAAHPDNALLDYRPLLECPVVVGLGPGPKLFPDLFVGPVPGVVFRVTLEVHALDLRRARADKSEPALV